MPLHKIFAQDMLVVIIGVVFAVIAPVVLIPCMIFCTVSRIVWTHQYLYIYENCCEYGGQFWPKVFRRFVFGIMLAQATVIGQFMLKGAFSQAYVCIILMVVTYFYLKRARSQYDLSSSSLPLEIAAVMDINVSNENDQQRRNKLYEKSYVQPALRARPKAAPEMPFPDVHCDTYDEDNSLYDEESGALDPKKALLQKTSKEHLLEKLLLAEESPPKTGVCKSTFQSPIEVEMIEAGWEKELQKQKRGGRWAFFDVLTGVDAGTLVAPSVSFRAYKSAPPPPPATAKIIDISDIEQSVSGNVGGGVEVRVNASGGRDSGKKNKKIIV